MCIRDRDYSEETLDVLLDHSIALEPEVADLSLSNDISELYNGLIYGIKEFFEKLPSKKVVIGLSLSLIHI